jgi:hypothetical protein
MAFTGLKNLYFLNMLITKTNCFFSITTFKKGHTLIVKTPQMLQIQHTERRTEYAAQVTLQILIKTFFQRYSRRDSRFIISVTTAKLHFFKKLIYFLLKKLKVKKEIFYIQIRHALPHNGCPLQAKKRRKNKGRNKRKKSIL